jgi:1-deoxy-D-xylulose-5-phosphate reductoisomerase
VNAGVDRGRPAGVAVLGATGSIGASALRVLAQHRDRFRVVGLSAHRNLDGLAELVARCRPAVAVLVEGGTTGIPQDTGARWHRGREALIDLVTRPDVDIVLNALVGAAGLEPTLAALRAGKRVALANKESLVCAGDLVLAACASGGGELIPVDSEHSAIFQCLLGGQPEAVERLVLTASGGPFRSVPDSRLSDVRARDALRHPTWSMGAKITVDSATLANKALEVIEAHFLFGVGYDRIDVVVHPQSIIHSMVEFVDGSMLAQLGFPTMEIPIAYALSFPERLPYPSRRFDPLAVGQLTFEAVRETSFPAFALGVGAGRAGGTAPAVFNAANEVAVAAFLADRLAFPGIAAAIDHALSGWDGSEAGSIGAVLEADRRARSATESYLQDHALC